MKVGRFDDRWPVHPLALGMVVAGILCVPFAIVTAILGHLPVRGGLLAGALLFAAAWAGLMIRSRPAPIFGADRRIRPSSPSPR